MSGANIGGASFKGSLGATPLKGISIGATQVWSASAAFDAIGAGGSCYASDATITWDHDNSGDAVVVAMSLESNVSGTSASMTYGGEPMDPLGASPVYTNAPWHVSVVLFGLLDAPAGTHPVIATMDSGTDYCVANSVSYSNVGSFGTVVTGSGAASPPSLNVPSGSGQRALYAVTTWQTNPSEFNQTERYLTTLAKPARPFLIGDAPGAASVNFSAALCDEWTAIAVPIIPA